MSVFIIAEAGVNHNGSIKLAKELIDVAVESGVDAVKFQTEHEKNTIQSFFTNKKIDELFGNFFKIIEMVVVNRNNTTIDHTDSRYHLILKRI